MLTALAAALAVLAMIVAVVFAVLTLISTAKTLDIARNPIPRRYGWLRRTITGRKGSARYYRWFPGELP